MSPIDRLTAHFPAAMLQTVLGRLAVLFLSGAGGDLDAARQAAATMLAEYDPRTGTELRLATEAISFGFHALEALSLAADPDRKLTQIIRLRGSAVSLSREAHKSQRKLDQLKRAPAQPRTEVEAAEPTRPAIDKALQAIETARAEPAAAKPQTWTQRYDQRQAARRMQAKLKKDQVQPAPSSVFRDAAPEPQVQRI